MNFRSSSIFFKIKKIILFFGPLIFFIKRYTIWTRIYVSTRVFLGLLFTFKDRITFIKRPLLAKDVRRASKISYANFAICFQGPVHSPFSIETIKIYKKTLPDINIIFSTWKGLDEKIVKDLEEIGVDLILQDPPSGELSNKPGFRATSFQIKSTMAALKYADKKGIEYSVKHRGDQRAYSSDWLLKLKALQNSFPNFKDSITEKKILLPSFTCPKFRIYGIGDQFHFGKTKDLINFWDSPYYEDGIHSLVKNEKIKNFLINGTPIFSEIYLMAKFLERNEYTLKWTLEDYWKVMKNNFCIFDCSYIDFVFFKENHSSGVSPLLYLEYREEERNYKAIHETNFTHADWIMVNNFEKDQLPWSNATQELWTNNNKDYFPPYFKRLKPGGANE